MAQTVDFVREEADELYVGATHVRLRSVIVAWEQGRAPEQIAAEHPDVPLAAVYGAIAIYLERRAEIDQRFAEEDAEFERTRLASQANDPAFYASIRKRIAQVRPHIQAELRAQGLLPEETADKTAEQGAPPSGENA